MLCSLLDHESTVHLAIKSRAYYKHIQFGMLELMHMSCFSPQDDDRVDDELVGDEEGWTFVTYLRVRK